MGAEEKLDYASTINKRLRSDIDFNKEHSPLVEEKLRLEEAAMVEVKKEQEHQKDVLRIARAKLKLAEEDFERKSQKIRDEMIKYEKKLEKVTETLDGLKADLKNKEDESEQIEQRI